MAIRGNWKRGLADFSKTVESKTAACTKATIVRLGNNIVARTPVDSGTLRDNWALSINDGQPRKFGTHAEYIEAMLASVPGIPTKVSIENDTHYAGIVESGSSSQAPKGMVALSVQQVADGINQQLSIVTIKDGKVV